MTKKRGKIMKIKQIGLKNLAELQKISRITFADTFGAENSDEDMKKHLDTAYSSSQLTTEIDNPNSFFYFGYVNGKLAGYLKLNVDDAQSDDEGQNCLEVERIYILPDFKRQGLGSKLIEVAEQIAKAKHKSEIWLGVWEGNPAAIAFYQAKGFCRTGQHVFTLGNDRQTDYIMKKRV
ncbi:GNAT family N-acetyltransferase [Fructilactobacillus sanfranciscensis]|uniref:Uncharacterized N-acetyltransferase in pepI 3'region n=2 Tax=Fructilactobacillus sanfranciscensis TaxID=1625 RepID=G2KTY1_FRUST|nr:Uncharacterized N-acetyltransferase in pepI 3'region [Fructilactobacillus sanfranciscensis TMW 1.1304]POH09628.1 GNAT family N-acetyltransferase [Fructilactobacillus sanfranciscensis]POH13110.1 GNAT family N-acetyltransferase [Fructilactobacillus sanfranciscensis]POH16493.1 GNAT family N-acetyltransferase [Fructilactobacillus sanfranciscensis]POH17786.1 GNAT family N-acetyltransferase [Fructilactobacillus sanfranciscensis]